MNNVPSPSNFSALLAHEIVRQQLTAELKEGLKNSPSTTLPGLDPQHLPAQGDVPYPAEPPISHDTIKLGIVGAGMAGIYTAYMIDRLMAQDPPVLNHKIEYEILEASSRMGGRCYTYKFSDQPHDYYDPGAMRFPEDPLMKRFFDFCEMTDTPTIPHYHNKGSVNCPMLFNGIHVVKDDAFTWESDPFQVAEELKIKAINPGDLLYDSLKEFIEPLLNKDTFQEGIKKLVVVDSLSTRDYLSKKFENEKEMKGYTDVAGLIQYIETFAGTTDLFTQSVSETVFQLLDFNADDWRCIEGGLAVLTRNAVSKLSRKPLLAKRVTKIELVSMKDGKDIVSSKVGIPKSMNVHVAGEKKCRNYNTVITTSTLGALSRIDLDSAGINMGVRNAIRSCRYAPATKVAIKFSYPWWITKCGITKGGLGLTDNLLRWCVYPSYNINDSHTESAVLLCSYTWTHDALRFGSLVSRTSPVGEEAIKELVLRELAALHQHKISYDEIAEAYITHHSYNWYQDPYASGACTSFTPGQFTEFYPLLSRPSGKGLLHIAGEATSIHHGWVVGALESAHRAVHYFLSRYQEKEALKKLVEIFGSLPELEIGEHGTSHLQMVMAIKGEDDKTMVSSPTEGFPLR